VYVFLAHHTSVLAETVQKLSVNDPSRCILLRDIQRVIEFFEFVEQSYVSDNVTLYMCHASIYTVLQDASKEFPLRLKEFRTVLVNIENNFSSVQTFFFVSRINYHNLFLTPSKQQ
jgi:hypothetical protein